MTGDLRKSLRYLSLYSAFYANDMEIKLQVPHGGSYRGEEGGPKNPPNQNRLGNESEFLLLLFFFLN